MNHENLLAFNNNQQPTSSSMDGPISINISLQDLLDNKDNIDAHKVIKPTNTLIDVITYIDNSNEKLQKLLYQVSASRQYCNQLMNSFYKQ